MNNDFAFYEEKITDKSSEYNTVESMMFGKEEKRDETESDDRIRKTED